MSKLEIENKKLKARVKELESQLQKHTGPTWETRLKNLVKTNGKKVEELMRNGALLPSNYNLPKDHPHFKTQNLSLYDAAHQRAISSGPENFIASIEDYIAR